MKQVISELKVPRIISVAPVNEEHTDFVVENYALNEKVNSH